MERALPFNDQGLIDSDGDYVNWFCDPGVMVAIGRDHLAMEGEIQYKKISKGEEPHQHQVDDDLVVAINHGRKIK